jgi:signal transduction histidine kinase
MQRRCFAVSERPNRKQVTKKTTGSLSFSIDARHVRQLGRELVADRITAVSELIKNAYDADATVVDVTFGPESERSRESWLSVSDDGVGMTLEDVRARWMVISTDYKDVAGVSPKYERRRAGQKGIGRFATESLGMRLTLRSTVSGSTERVVVEFDWANAYGAGQRLDLVSNPYRIEEATVDEHGTELFIEGLHHVWDARSLSRIREAVFLLQPPFRLGTQPLQEPSGGDPGFRVIVHYQGTAPEIRSRGDVETVLDSATAWIEGSVDDSGNLHRRIRSRHLGIDETETLQGRALLTGSLNFSAAYFIFKKDALDPEGSVGVRRARSLAQQFGGIRLYRDGLRILPYGEPANDWLGLDAIYRRRGQILAPIGSNNFFGEVLISREENVLLIDTASREGVIENEPFEELRIVLRETLTWAVSKIAAVRQRKLSASRPTQSPESREELLEGVASAANRVASARTDEEKSASLLALLRATEEAREEARRSDRIHDQQVLALLDELSLLRVLASVGGAIAVFSHEVRVVLTQAIAAVGDVADLVGTSEILPFSIAEAERGLEGIADLASYLDIYISQSGRRQREPQPLREVLDSFQASVTQLLVRRGVSIGVEVSPSHLRTAPMSRSELQAVLYNLLTNSLRALDSEGLMDRQIRIEAFAEGSDIILRFKDSGTGIDERIRDSIFDAFVTTTREGNAELGAGTGLGLKIVADIAEANRGSASIGSAAPPFATCMVVRLPQWNPISDETKSDP